MMNPIWRVFAGGLLTLAIAGTAAAQAPEQIHYQGFLTDVTGTPLHCPSAADCPSGQVNILFRLYPQEAGGTPVWAETIAGVPVRNGILNVVLGQTSPIQWQDLDQAQTWLGVEVNLGGELSPRQRLVSSPYAVYARRTSMAADSEQLGGTPASDYVLVSDLLNAAYLDEGELTDYLLSNGFVSGDKDTLGALSCASGQIPQWAGNAWVCDPDNDALGALGAGGTCDAGEVAKWSGNTWTCQPDVDTRYSGANFALSGRSCAGVNSVMTGVDPLGRPICKQDTNTTYNGTNFAVSGRSCAAGQYMTGISASGTPLCADFRNAVRDYVRSSCYIYFGWRDSCSDCTTTPTKWGRVRHGACDEMADPGGDSNCFNVINSAPNPDHVVRMYGLNTDGDVGGDDKFYIGYYCE
ncbi:MAG: hypothetical protein ACI9MR_003689 [Myxococcota bacterium]|jgi:hypothetical protein